MKKTDAVVAAPNSHKVLLENDRVRVLEVVIPPLTKEPMHTHEWSSAMIIGSSTKIRYYDHAPRSHSPSAACRRFFLKRLKPALSLWHE